jgi:hypothetical protein
MIHIFLHGAVMSRTIDQLNDFAIAETQLLDLGFKVTTAMEGFPHPDEAANPELLENYLRQRRETMLQCQHVLFIEGYEYDPLTIADIKEARANGILTQEVTAFIDRYKLAIH